MFPPKKTPMVEAKKSNRHAVSRAQLMRRGGPDVVQCLIFSGAAVGVDEEALNSVGVLTALMLDNDWEKLGVFGDRVFYTLEDAVRAIPSWDFVLDGPVRLCASFQRGYTIEGVAYWEENQWGRRIRTLKGYWDNGESLPKRDPRRRENDYVQLLKAVHARFSRAKIMTVFSTPCRLFSVANGKKNNSEKQREKQEYLAKTCLVMKRAAFAVKYLRRLGVQVFLWAECSLGEAEAQEMCKALNSVEGRLYGWQKVRAQDYHSPSVRNRVLFAPFAAFDYLPQASQEERGWGPVLRVCANSKVCLQGGTWRPKLISGKFGTEIAHCATQMPYVLFLNGKDEEVHLIAATPRQKALLVGVCPWDPRLPKLDKIPNNLGNTIVGVGFSAQWFLAVTFACLGAMRLMGSPENVSRAFWALERMRAARHPPPIPGNKKHSLQKQIENKIKIRELSWQSC